MPQLFQLDIFNLTVSTRIALFRSTGSVRKGIEVNRNKSRWPPEVQAHVLEYIEIHPCFFIEELQEELIKQFPLLPNVSAPTICRALEHDLKISRKILERRAREIRPREISDYKYRLGPFFLYPEQLVCIDEVSKDSRGSIRKHAWSRIGTPALVNLPQTRGKRVSALAAFNHKGFLAWGYTPDTFTRHTFHEVFVSCILPHLKPWPLPNSIIIVDNAKIHMYQEFIDAVQSRGAIVIFLPPFCPHFNPIETGFSLLKRWIQKHANIAYNGSPELVLDLAFQCCVSDENTPVAMFAHCGYERGGLSAEKFPDFIEEDE